MEEPLSYIPSKSDSRIGVFLVVVFGHLYVFVGGVVLEAFVIFLSLLRGRNCRCVLSDSEAIILVCRTFYGTTDYV